MTVGRAFLASDVVLAAAVAAIIEATLFILLATASNNTTIQAKEDDPPPPIPIEVKPVLDEMPLLKLGSKRVRAKLPDMWVKKPPIRRYEAASAPSPSAENDVNKIPDTPLVKPSAEAPPPDAAIAKKVDETMHPDAAPPPKQAPQLAEEGAEDGIKGGTEKDPLKAFAVSQYRARLSAWFNVRFKPKQTGIPCEELKKLRASISAKVGPERTVLSYSITRPSGNAAFDAQVKATLDGIVSSAAELPPPPPNYADILGTTIAVGFFVPTC